MKNWWYYYKWYVLGGVLLLGIAINLTGSAFGWFQKKPDIQIAYVGQAPLPGQTVTALEQAFSSLISDYNGDGEVLIQVHQYAGGNPDSGDSDTFYYQYAEEVTLIGDINDCESYFFLMEDPKEFQRGWQLLAAPDGSAPDALDFSTEDKTFLWKDCPLLAGQELGTYQDSSLGQKISGSNQELLGELYLGRRCFYNEKRTENEQECAQLWEEMSNSCPD